MGAGASADNKEALKNASDEQIREVLAGLDEAQKKKVLDALTNAEAAKAPAEAAPAAAVADDLAVIVTVKIKEDRVPDFLAAMEKDAKGSRAEAGCKRFDLLQNKDDKTEYIFYEVYKDKDCLGTHKETDHYKAWADFKASGGVESQTVVKGNSTTIPGGWAFQSDMAGAGCRRDGVCPAAVSMTMVHIKEGCEEAFLKAMESVSKSRDKETEPGCLRFDLMKDTEKPGTFILYEAYTDDEALGLHLLADYYKPFAKLKKSGEEVDKEEVKKFSCSSIDGGWAFQTE